MITRIRIPSRWAEQHPTGRSVSNRDAVADFTLGIGPCGKTVIELDIEHAISGVLITQVCSDTESKSFFYPYHTVTGRIEITENNS